MAFDNNMQIESLHFNFLNLEQACMVCDVDVGRRSLGGAVRVRELARELHIIQLHELEIIDMVQ